MRNGDSKPLKDMATFDPNVNPGGPKGLPRTRFR
jgi:hypothetical protein